MSEAVSRARLKALLDELARLGSPVDSSVAVTEVENQKVEIEQVGGIYESRIFELEDRRIAYMAYIAVTNRTSRAIDVVDVELRATWDDSLFQWLTPLQVNTQDRKKRGSSLLVYQFPREPGLQLACGEVMNGPLVERRRLPGNRRLEGWLLGIGGFMPVELRGGEPLDATLRIIGSDQAEYSKAIHLWTDRLQARPKIVKPRTSIFAKLMEEEALDTRDVTGPVPLPASQPPVSNGS